MIISHEMDSGFRIFIASTNDLDDIWNLLQEQKKFFIKYQDGLEFKMSKNDLEDAINSGTKVLLAKDGHEAVAVLMFGASFSTLGGATWFMEEFHVKESHRRRRIGKLMMSELCHTALEDETVIEWQCFTWNQNAIDFYKSIGAKIIQECEVSNMKCYYFRLERDAIEALDAIDLELDFKMFIVTRIAVEQIDQVLDLMKEYLNEMRSLPGNENLVSKVSKSAIVSGSRLNFIKGFVATHSISGRIVGFLTYSVQRSFVCGKSYMLDSIYVNPGFRKLGIGNDLLTHLIKVANGSSLKGFPIEFNCWSENRTALLWFEKLGAQIDGRSKFLETGSQNLILSFDAQKIQQLAKEKI